MEDLNKSQLLLLAILTSFVTSIATGIMTVSLLNQAPVNVTQTINRVVERTVEKVVPGETKVREVPVVVTEEELIIKVINTVSPAVAKVALSSEKDKTIGLTYFINDGSLAVTAYDALPAVAGVDRRNPGPYTLTLENGVVATAELGPTDPENKVALLKVIKTEVAPKSTASIPTIKLIKGDPVVGQTVVAIGSITADTSPAAVGIISSLIKGVGTTTVAIKANPVSADNLGGPILSIQGEALGVNVGPGLAATTPIIRDLIDSVK